MSNVQNILAHTVQRCRDKNIIIPTYQQMRDPGGIPAGILTELKRIGLWDLHPRNLFRITWKNEPLETGGGFGPVNYMEMPRELTGVAPRILVLVGKFFPTGAHKVGATFGPLVERLVTGRFDPTSQKALWPSTGNYCRGGAYDAALLGCGSIAVLPEEMSRERFEWLEKVGSEIYRTPGGESNVKEIYDRTRAIVAERGEEVVVLNQFEEMGNSRWHYTVTGPALEEVFKREKTNHSRCSALFLTQGSAGTLASGDYLKEHYPALKIAAGEALQCPTLLYGGYGEHRIEGIGDKHVPWIHNLRNTDMVCGIDDEIPLRLMRLFNEPAGQEYLSRQGIPEECVDRLPLLGISSLANLVGAIKMAKYYEFNADDMVFTVATDSMAMYQSRLQEARQSRGEYGGVQAGIDFEGRLLGLNKDDIRELTYYDRKRIHNLKYFTWIEQLGKSVEELDAQWYDQSYWKDQYAQVADWDKKIDEFNRRTGLLKKYQ